MDRQHLLDIAEAVGGIADLLRHAVALDDRTTALLATTVLHDNLLMLKTHFPEFTVYSTLDQLDGSKPLDLSKLDS